MRSLPPRTIVPLTMPRTLSHRSGSIMIAGPFLGTLAPGQISPTVLDRAGGRSLRVSAVRLLQCIALAVSARPLQRRAQLGKNPVGGTGIEVSEMSPLIARAS